MKFPIKALLSIALLASSSVVVCITDADLTPENLAKTAARFNPNKKHNALNEVSFLASKLLEEQNAHGAAKQQLSTVTQELSTVKGSRWYRFGAGLAAARAQAYTGAVSAATGAQDSVLSYKANYTTNASRTGSALTGIGAALLHIPFRGVTSTVNGARSAGAGIASGTQSVWSKVPARPALSSMSMPKIGWPTFFNRTK